MNPCKMQIKNYSPTSIKFDLKFEFTVFIIWGIVIIIDKGKAFHEQANLQRWLPNCDKLFLYFCPNVFQDV